MLPRPDEEYTLARSAEADGTLLSGGRPVSMLALRTLRGSDSRLPPHTEFGAIARIDASVSMLRRRCLEEEASVRILALSDDRLFVVAEL
jgi:hypothetical protein